MVRPALALAWLALLAPAAGFAQDTGCASLGAARLADAKVLSAEWIAASPAAPWRSAAGLFAAAKIDRPFCRVTGQAIPAPGSDIRFELWLASRNAWNGRFFGTAPPAPTGAIAATTLVNPLNRGYAAMTHDNGHVSRSHGDTGWAVDGGGNPDPVRIADYGWRAQHAATVAAKAIAALYYGRPPARAFFLGCGLGGHHGLMEAQRFAADYDGIVAGASSGELIGMLATQRWNLQTIADGGLSKDVLQTVGERSRDSCDAQDGLADGQIEDPRACPGETGLADLAEPQRRAVQALRRGPPDGHGLAPGAETGLAAAANAMTAATELLRRLGGTGDDLAEIERRFGPDLNVGDLTLREFAGRGGKLIVYQGWADPQTSPLATLAGWQKLLAANPAAARTARLFLVPGMGQCSGGPLGAADWLTAIETWVERDVPPISGTINAVVGSGSVAGKLRQRILCPYPSVARHVGGGDINADAYFRCKIPS